MNDYTPPNKLEDQEILNDMQKTAEKVDGKLTIKKYRKHGQYSAWAAQTRWGWNNAKEKIGLETLDKGEHREIPEEKLLEDMRRVYNQVDGKLASTEYIEHGKYSVQTAGNKFGSWQEAAEEAGIEVLQRGDKVVPVEKFKEIEEQLQNKRGRIHTDDLRHMPEKPLQKHVIEELVQFLNERDNGLTITRSGKGGNNSNIFVENEDVGMYDDYYEMLPEGTEQVFDAVMSDASGKSPQSVTAGINYIYFKNTKEEITQKKAGKLAGVSEVTARKAYQYLEEKGHDRTIKEAREQ